MKYRKKPVVIDAIQWNGENNEEIENFVGYAGWYSPITNTFVIKSLEGIMDARVNDFIIKEVNGEFYPCKPDIFEKTYEVVEDERKD